MICQACKDEGKTSRVAILGSSRTLLGYSPFYDEQGRLHHHDPNTTRTEFRCSNGHRFAENSGSGKCWCEQPAEHEKDKP